MSGGRTQQANASVRAAFVHVMGDLLQSVSVLVSAVIIFFKVTSLSLYKQGTWRRFFEKPKALKEDKVQKLNLKMHDD